METEVQKSRQEEEESIDFSIGHRFLFVVLADGETAYLVDIIFTSEVSSSACENVILPCK
jgi:hypothetical protein